MNIVITGASRGIGFETAKLLCKDGHTVVAVARTADKLKVLERECKGNLTSIAFDLASGAINELAARIAKTLPQIDVLVNNAGTLVNKPFEQISSGELEQVYRVNVFSVFMLVQGLLPAMKEGSHVLNISSMGGYQGSAKFAGLSAYSSSKGALATLSECLAEELKPKKIAVNCLCLGAVQTEMLEQAFPRFKAPVSAEDMGAFIADFAVRGQKYFNGKVLPVSLSTP